MTATTETPAGQAPRVRSPLVLATAIAVLVVAVQALLVPLFTAPNLSLEPRDLPVVVAGPAQAADQLAARLADAKPGAFEVTTVADAEAADRALRDREAYAAFVLGPDGVAVHTASAASPTVATLLTQAAGQLAPGGTADGPAVRVVDVVPTDPDDPRGVGFAGGFLPLVMTGVLAGVLLLVAVRQRWARLLGLGVFGVLAGLVGAIVQQHWLGVLPGSYWLDAAVIGLTVLAVSATVAGLGAALGRAGVALGVIAVFLVGNPLSAVSAAPELLPQPWGAVGQLLPVGAGSTLLRSVAYFDGAGGGAALAVLLAYAVAGLVLVLVGRAKLVGR